MLVERWIQDALENPSGNAFRLLLERLDGKQVEQVEHSHHVKRYGFDPGIEE